MGYTAVGFCRRGGLLLGYRISRKAIFSNKHHGEDILAFEMLFPPKNDNTNSYVKNMYPRDLKEDQCPIIPK